MPWLRTCLSVTVGVVAGLLVGGALGWFIFVVTQSGLDPLYAIGYVMGGAGLGGLAGGFLGFWFVASR
jgi:hypothetical protein